MPRTQAQLQQLSWRKARRSMNNGDCVEVATVDGQIFVRDSKNPAGDILESPPGMWRSFVLGVQQGNFNVPCRVKLSRSSSRKGRPCTADQSLPICWCYWAASFILLAIKEIKKESIT
jgi:hypothetical protein